MKKVKIFSVAIACAATVAVSCGTATGTSSSGNAAADALGTLIGATVGGAVGSAAETAVNAGTVISGIIGQLTQKTSANTIVGTWIYTEPTVQFESESLLAKAGGAMAANAIITKIEPYYKKAGITPGRFAFTFNKDNTCTYQMNGQTYTGTYKFDKSTNTIAITGSYITFPSAYITVSSNNLAMTFDSTKLLTLVQGLGVSKNQTLSSIGTLSSSFSGMKTGFLFTKQ